MINKLRMSAAGAALAVMAMASAANAAETETATAEADVVLAFTLTKDADLDFGAIAVDAAGGDVDVAADGTVTCGGAHTCYGTTSAAAFSVSGGTIGKTLYFDLPDTSGGPLTMVHANKAALQLANPLLPDAAVEIDLDSFVTDAALDAVSGQYTITIQDAGLAGGGAATGVGAAEFAIGATATFDGTEVEGYYSTTFDVTVDYE